MCVLAWKRGIACHCPDHVVRIAPLEQGGQVKRVMAPQNGPAVGWELVVPNPTLKLMDQVREVLRVKHCAIRTEHAYCEWIRRYIRFHGMPSREELFPGTEKVERFPSDLAVNGHAAAATQNQGLTGSVSCAPHLPRELMA